MHVPGEGRGDMHNRSSKFMCPKRGVDDQRCCNRKGDLLAPNRLEGN